MRLGSLCSGTGMHAVPVEDPVARTTAWHCEQDTAASAVLATHWPDTPNLGDITAVDFSAVEPVDIIVAGFPCQDLSAAGKRTGLRDGTRSGLWSYCAEAIDVLRPALVIIENVRGICSARAHRAVESRNAALGDGSDGPVLLRALGAVLGDLSDLGYDARWATVPASAVGAPHRRERVFVLAYPADTDGASRWQYSRGASTEEAGSQTGDRFGGAGGKRATGDRRAIADAAGDRWDQGLAQSARLGRGSDAALGDPADPGVMLPDDR